MRELFIDEEVGQDIEPEPADPAILNRRYAYINPRVLDDARIYALGGEHGIQFQANLFDKVSLQCNFDRKYIEDEYVTFQGKVIGNLESRVAMTVTPTGDRRTGDKRTLITLRIWTGEHEFLVTPLDEYTYRIVEINQSAPIECDSSENSEVSEDNASNEKSLEEKNPGKSGASFSSAEIKPGDYIVRLLVLYNASVGREAGPSAVKPIIRQLVLDLNGALDASLNGLGVAVRIQIADIIEVDFESMPSSYDGALYYMTQSQDIAKLRNELSADLVTMLRTLDGTSKAYCLSNAAGNRGKGFSVVKYAQAVYRHSLSHEIGHNFGCAHDPENADCKGLNNGLRPPVHFGHNWRHSIEKEVRGTLLSYVGKRLLYFSNPDVKYKGDPTGTKERNNALAIAKSAPAISQYRN